MATTKVTTPVTDFDKPFTEEGLKIPSGTSSTQPTGVTGMVRNDTTQSSKGSVTAITHYNGTNWRYFENELNTSFNTVLYNGNGSTNSITGVGFQPDLVWIKSRDTAYNHRLFDSVRGLSTDGILYSNLTNAAENLPSINDNFVSLDANGFTLGSTSSTNGSNFNGDSFVAWCFNAGGVEETNTEGTTQSTVRANNDLGFSIVKTSGTSGQITFGHGLNTAPEMIINKGITSSGWSWLVYHKDIGTGKYIKLNSTDASITNAGSFSSVTSTTITNNSSNSSSDYINYCFASKPNYSKTGSYVGNGNTTGPIVTLGFEPAFVMIKGVDEITGWTMLDNKRDTSNPNSARLDADDAMAEYSAVGLMDFNSDGFQLKTSNAGQNANGKTFIYLAFANTI